MTVSAKTEFADVYIQYSIHIYVHLIITSMELRLVHHFNLYKIITDDTPNKL